MAEQIRYEDGSYSREYADDRVPRKEAAEVDMAAVRELAEAYRRDEYVPIDHADLVALLDRLGRAEAAVARMKALIDEFAESAIGTDFFGYPLNGWVHVDRLRDALGGDQ